MNPSGQSPLIFGPLPQSAFEADVGQSFRQQQQHQQQQQQQSYNNGPDPQARHYHHQQQQQRGYIRWNQVKKGRTHLNILILQT